jgi:antitoxin component YwqK of YwqJK toxin-antitoxin module
MHGQAEGPATSWHPNGQMESQGNYQNGRREGAWRFWLPDGSEDARRSGNYQGDRKTDG